MLVRVPVLHPVNCSQPTLASFEWTLIKACDYKLRVALNCVLLNMHAVVELTSELFSIKAKRIKTKEKKKKCDCACYWHECFQSFSERDLS